MNSSRVQWPNNRESGEAVRKKCGSMKCQIKHHILTGGAEMERGKAVFDFLFIGSANAVYGQRAKERLTALGHAGQVRINSCFRWKYRIAFVCFAPFTIQALGLRPLDSKVQRLGQKFYSAVLFPSSIDRSMMILIEFEAFESKDSI